MPTFPNPWASTTTTSTASAATRDAPETVLVIESCIGPAFPLGTWFGIPVTIHFSYFALLFIALLSSLSAKSLLYSLYQFLLVGPILFISILIHEYGHVFATKRLGGTAHGIIMWPLGGLAILGKTNPDTYRNRIIVAAAGPATHLFQMVACLLGAFLISLLGTSQFFLPVYTFMSSNNLIDLLAGLCVGGFYLNLSLMLFNLLLPAYPLDGGQIFASALMWGGCVPKRAGILVAVTGMAVSGVLAIWGLVLFFVRWSGFINIIIALWIGWTSFQLYRMAGEGRVREHPLFQTEATDEPAPSSGPGNNA
mmetsp:Transcript_20805/g.41621  ORF Transcript_20805/g.41621 Transcript_20805/m.41621 type:complete len:309 (+) Transcript_20805:124-1050(+)